MFQENVLKLALYVNFDITSPTVVHSDLCVEQSMTFKRLFSFNELFAHYSLIIWVGTSLLMVISYHNLKDFTLIAGIDESP